MNLTEFFQILKESVQHSNPAPNKWEQLQTFAVLRGKNDLNTDNLGKNIYHKDSAFFYSRKWEGEGFNPSAVTFEYPAMIAIPLSASIENPLKGQPPCYFIELYFLYPNLEKLEPGVLSACKKLLTEEIYVQMNDMARCTFDYLKGIVYATIDGPLNVWHHSGLLDQMVTDGIITSWTQIMPETARFQAMLRQKNQVAEGGFIDDMGAHMLSGMRYRIGFCEQECPTYTFDFTTRNCCAEF